MRRALVLIAVLVATLLGTASTSAWAGEGSVLRPEFRLRADGFIVELRTMADSRRVMLTLWRHGQSAFYETTAKITEGTITAHFGRLGDLDYTFTPAPGKGPHCAGAIADPEGTFRGSFDFTGENRYVHFEADHAHGNFETFPAAVCEKTRAPALLRRKLAKGAKPMEVALAATAGGRPSADYLLAFTLPTENGLRLFINGFHAEVREGMLIERGAQIMTRPGVLRWDSSLETARLDPPAPFRGSAEYTGGPHGKGSWTGSLRTPLLGGGTLHLAGGRFKAEFGEGTIIG